MSGNMDDVVTFFKQKKICFNTSTAERMDNIKKDANEGYEKLVRGGKERKKKTQHKINNNTDEEKENYKKHAKFFTLQ